MTDLLRIADLGDRLPAVVEATRMARHDREFGAGHLRGRQFGLFFEKPSTRTRVSSEVAIRRLGGDAVVLTGDGIGLGTREPAQDVARVLDRMLDGLACRVASHRNLETLARHADIPVINLLSDLEHPCQAVADLATIAEHKPVHEATVAYVGDGNNVATSLAWGVIALGGRMRVATPAGHALDPDLLPHGVEALVDPDEAVRGADVVYTDVWTSMGQEAEREDRLREFAGWGIDIARFRRAADDAIFLHCLPAHRGEEVSTEVLEHPRSRVFDQAEFRLHAFTALAIELW